MAGSYRLNTGEFLAGRPCTKRWTPRGWHCAASPTCQHITTFFRCLILCTDRESRQAGCYSALEEPSEEQHIVLSLADGIQGMEDILTFEGVH